MSDANDSHDPSGAVEPFPSDVEIDSYRSYLELISGHSAGSLHSLYDEDYYRLHVGSKEHADLYFATNGLGETEFTRKPLALARIHPEDRVLDIGCGRGEMVFQSVARGARAVGIDYSEAAVRIATATCAAHDPSMRERMAFFHGDAGALPFDDASFDRAFLLDVVEHLSEEELATVLAQARRVLAPSGLLVIHTPNSWTNTGGHWFMSAYNLVTGRPKPEHPVVEWARALEGDPDYDPRKILLHVHEIGAPELKRALSHAGFKSKVWVDEIEHRWHRRTDLTSRLASTAIRVACLRYLLGREMYAVAKPRR